MAKQDDYVRYTIRIPADLYERVKIAAGEKSVNAEIIDRLDSYDRLRESAKALEQECHRLNTELMRHVHEQAEVRMKERHLRRLSTLAAQPGDHPSELNAMLRDPKAWADEEEIKTRVADVYNERIDSLIEEKLGEVLNNTIQNVADDLLKRWVERIVDRVENTTHEETRKFLEEAKAAETETLTKRPVSGSNYWRNKQAARRERMTKESSKPDATELEGAEREAHAQAVFPRLAKIKQQDQGQKVPFLSREARKRAMKDDDAV